MGKAADPQPIKFPDAKATYSQQGYEVKSAPSMARPAASRTAGPSTAATASRRPPSSSLRQPVPLSPGGSLKLVFKQQYPDGKHSLGRFRLSLTNDTGPLNFGLSKEVIEVLAIAPISAPPNRLPSSSPTSVPPTRT